MAKQINKMQIQAVIDTVRKNLEEKDAETLKAYRESLKKNKKYKDFRTCFENIKKLEEERNEINNKISIEKRKAYNLLDPNCSYNESYYDYSDFKYREKDFVEKELKSSDIELKMSTFNSDNLKNELLISSIDPEFSIQNFIDTYSK